MNKNEELQKWLNDDRYVQLDKLAEMYDCNIPAMKERLRNRGILGVKKIKIGFGGKSYCFYDKKDCIRLLNLPSKSAQSRDCQIKKYLNDKQFVQLHEISKSWGLTKQGARAYLANSGIKPIKKIYIPQGGSYAFYLEVECRNARQSFLSKKEYIENTMIENPIYITTKELSNLWGISEKGVGAFLARMKIKHVKAINMGYPLGLCTIYDRAECERARPFINQPEQKEVETMDEKMIELPEPKEQALDIIPADTIDLFTMSELETELKNRGIELTAEVRNKINASDMPEMQHIATMLRGNAKTITIRLSVLNEIAGQLREIRCGIKNESLDEIGKPRVLWLNMQERVVFEFLRYKAKYTTKRDIVEHFKATRQPMDDSAANRAVWAAISALRDMGCLDAQNGCFMINSNYTSTEAESREVWGRMDASKRKTDPVSIDIGLENGKPINDKIKESGWYTVGIISEISGKSESWLRSHLPIEDCLIEYGNNKLIKVWMPKRVIQWLNDRNIFVRGWGSMKKYPKNGMRKYNPDFDKIAFDMASQNKSDIEISNRLDVGIDTFNKYKKEIPSFSNAINSGMAAYVTSITSSQSKAETTHDKGICINQDLKDKLRFMAMADNVDLVTKLESIITAAWIMGNYEKK